MKNYRKRTLALVLASVITVAGSFAAENYKNTLMGLDFQQSPSGINMVVVTRTAFNEPITPKRVDAETYVLIMRDVDSKASTPNLNKAGGNLKSVDIRQMPYSGDNHGYTKITIKTFPNINLSTCNAVYIPSKNENQISETRPEPSEAYPQYQEERRPEKSEYNRQRQEEVQRPVRQDSYYDENARIARPDRMPNETIKTETPTTAETTVTPPAPPVNNMPAQSDNSARNQLLVALGIILISLVAAYSYSHAKSNIQSITGENFDIDIEDEDQKDSKTSTKDKKNIRKTINKLDKKYSNSSVIAGLNKKNNVTPVKTVKPEQELNVVDLDELFKEHSQKETQSSDIDENDALEAFLNGFSFEEEPEEPENTVGYDEEYFEKVIKENNIEFTPEDLKRIQGLLSLEIYDETLKNIDKYAVSNPIKESRVSPQTILEKLVTDYTISQNITFTQDDISVLKKLMSVEIDNDFVTDLRTNPNRTKEMEKEIKSHKAEIYKPSEILTLNVKDMLPDLSKAMEEQGDKPIESNAKPDVVYFSEGYEVSTLSVTDMPDLSVEINNESSYVSKPTAEYEISDLTYDVDKLDLSVTLPDLQDVIKNPEKYAEQPKEEYIPDEKEMLERLSNAVFKPFAEERDDFEIVNKPEDIPTIHNIQEEMSEFSNFEITEEEDLKENSAKSEDTEFHTIQEETYINLDELNKSTETKPQKTTVKPNNTPVQSWESAKIKPLEVVKQNNSLPKKENKSQNIQRQASKRKSEDLLKRIEASRTEREERKKILLERQKNEALQNKLPRANTNQQKTFLTRYIIDGESYNVIESAALKDNISCHLAKCSTGFVVLSASGRNACIIKHYEKLKSTALRVRLTEKFENNVSRFLIRVGENKFVADIKDGKLNFVMDLC